MSDSLDRLNVDDFIMLLSTDWFFDHWTVIGVDVDETRRLCLKAGARAIVRAFMSGATEYWLVSFAGERIEETRSEFNALLQKCRADEATIDRIKKLTCQKPAVDLEVRIQGILHHLTATLVSGSSAQELPRIDPSLRQAVVDFWNRHVRSRHDIADIDFHVRCLNADSSWDQYIRSLTPDLPDMLANSLTQAFIVVGDIELLWNFIHRELSREQREELFRWYRAAGTSITQGEVTLSELR
jgi:hypothetical protein